MQAQKITTCTDEYGRLVNLPTFKPMQEIELIILYSEKKHLSPLQKRRPPEKLKGMLVEKGDILSSASHDDWGIS